MTTPPPAFWPQTIVHERGDRVITPIEAVTHPDGSLVLMAGGEPIATCHLSRRRFGRSRLTRHAVVLGPWRLLAPDPDVPALVRAALRAVILDAAPWHRITVQDEGIGHGAIDAAWRYAVWAGLRCDIRTDTAWCVAVIWDNHVKARWWHAVTQLRGPAAPPPRPAAPGTRYFTLDATSVRPPRDAVTLMEVSAPYIYHPPTLPHGSDLFGSSPRMVEGAIRRGDRCFVVMQGDRLLYRMWVSDHREHVSGLVPPSILRWPALYVYDCYTAPEARGQGIYGHALVALAVQMRAQYQQLIVRINPDNEPSIRGVTKVGFMEAIP